MDGGAWKASVHGATKSDMTERLHFHFSLSCIGEGNGNPLQCSCLENPRDGGAWWAAVYGVAQSWRRLKRLSSTVYIIIFIFMRNYMRNSVLMAQFCFLITGMVTQTPTHVIKLH